MKNVLIFGDSYSTYADYIPQGFATYYPQLDVRVVEDTWWYDFIAKNNLKLVRNDSWSGSTIGYTGYENTDCSHSSSFIYRYRQLKEKGFFEENEVDTVLVFGGTNDSWSNAPLGEPMYENWKEEDLFSVLPAICHFAGSIKKDFPDITLVFIINEWLNPKIQDCIEDAAAHFGAKSVRLKNNVSKENNHPTAAGMKQISEQLTAALG